MNILFGLKISRNELADIALKLGSDVPYCLMRGTALAAGRGEVLTKLPECPNAWVVLAKPQMSLSTAAVYKAFDEVDLDSHPDTDLVIKAIADNDILKVASNLSNVLENVSIPMCPMVGKLKKSMISYGALGALMSGSGPTVYGLFDDRIKAQMAAERIKKEFKIRDVILTKIFNA